VYLNSGTNYTVLAALNILQNSDVKVYVGVENESQKKYLQTMYPKVRRKIINIIWTDCKFLDFKRNAYRVLDLQWQYRQQQVRWTRDSREDQREWCEFDLQHARVHSI